MSDVKTVRAYLERQPLAKDVLEAFERLTATRERREENDVTDFNLKFGLPIARAPRLLEMPDLRDRHDFLDEEVTEFYKAMHHGDMVALADALVDVVFVAKGTAVMMGLSWREHWDAVCKANMAKELSAERSGYKRGVVKPKGWQPPDHASVFARAGFKL